MPPGRPARPRSALHRRRQAQGQDERKRLLNAADVAILCLPDDAARESVSLIDNGTTRVIDASTAFRVDPDWAYGFLISISTAIRWPSFWLPCSVLFCS